MEFYLSKEFEKYKDLWDKAMNHDDTDAQYELASKLKKSNNQDIRKTVLRLFRRAANKEHLRALLELGICYETGYGIKRDLMKSIGCYKTVDQLAGEKLIFTPTATEHRAEEKLDILFENPQFFDLLDKLIGEDISKRPIEEVMDFANGGDADAQHELAIRYYYGTKDVAKDIKEAEYWWLKAAEQDHEYAVRSLAEKYLYHHRPEEAVKWYRKHAELRIAWHDNYKST